MHINRSFKLLVLALASCSLATAADTYKRTNDIPYAAADSEEDLRKLDFYYPDNSEGFATFIWFHGGGLKKGRKHIPDRLKEQGIAVIGAGYRLYPEVATSDCLADAAAAVAWAFENIESYGGSKDKIFLSGHSAGGYLAAMVVYDKHWLGEHGIDSNSIAGVIPYSGHMITHMAVREERGIPSTQPIIDEFAPLYHVRSDAPPTLLLTGYREFELLGRYEENAYMYRMLKVAGHQDVTLYEFDGYGHGMRVPADPIALKFVERVLNEREQAE